MSDPFDAIHAQPHAVKTLRAASADGRIASAYLFVGPSGVGKEKAALALAEATIGNGHRIANGHHPDVRIFRPRDEGNRNIKVDYLRQEILPYADFAPFEAAHAFLIFPEVDVSFPEAHPESANALLKTLEEPRRGVHFVLLAERPDRLLPTIRSRCQRVGFEALPGGVLASILNEHGVPSEHQPAAIALADGRADRALELAADGTARALFDLALDIDEAVAQPAPGQLVETASRLAKHDRLPLALDTLLRFYRDVARVCAGASDDVLAFQHYRPALDRCAQSIDVGRAAARVGLITAALADLEVNANATIAMDALLFRMRTAR